MMFNPEIFLITLTLVLLAGAAYWMKIPIAIFPLSIVYLLFILLNDSSKDLLSKVEVRNSTTMIELETDNDLLNNAIKPTPLTFDSGRTKKKQLNKRINKKPANSVYQPKSNINPNQDENANSLRLRDIQICRNVVKRNPEGTDVFFSKNVDSLFCYTRIQNQGKKQEVKHVWYYEGDEMTRIRYNIKKSNIYRSWTRKTILPHQIGKWRVDIQDTSGKIIGSKEFQIIK